MGTSKAYPKSVSNDRKHCCQTNRTVVEAAAYAQAVFQGKAKGRCGRLCATCSLPVHRGRKTTLSFLIKTSPRLLLAVLVTAKFHQLLVAPRAPPEAPKPGFTVEPSDLLASKTQQRGGRTLTLQPLGNGQPVTFPSSADFSLLDGIRFFIDSAGKKMTSRCRGASNRTDSHPRLLAALPKKLRAPACGIVLALRCHSLTHHASGPHKIPVVGALGIALRERRLKFPNKLTLKRALRSIYLATRRGAA